MRDVRYSRWHIGLKAFKLRFSMLKSDSVKDGCILLIGASSLETTDFRVRLDRSGVRYQAFTNVSHFLSVVTRFEHAVVFLGIADIQHELEDEIKSLRARSSTAKIVVYAACPSSTLLLEAMRAGASDFVDYANEVPLLFEHIYRCANLTRARFEDLQRKLNISVTIPLSDSDFAILDMLERRMAVKEISKAIQLSPRTVHLRKKQLLSAFGVASKKELLSLIESIDVPDIFKQQDCSEEKGSVEGERAA